VPLLHLPHALRKDRQMQSTTIDNPLIAFLGIALLTIIFFYAVFYLISVMTGWFVLGKRFRQQSEPYGETRSAGPFFYTIYMRCWSHYSSVVRLTAAADALYVSILFLFRIGHPPLRIPWDEIQFGRTKFLFWTFFVVTLGNEEKIPMRISERMARNLGILDRCPVS
jgi:hypothetical protein